MGIILAVLVLWLSLAIIGFAIKTLFWLAIIACVLFFVTLATGVIMHVRRP